ncbi:MULTISPECIES: HlyD family type I secretion periplasmic adaptor subunit [Pelosinus]|jgi:hemolysin D|uniref:Type I secretion membrane fusion protein, HlyD family n=1 Tax=Pelosinus fermentans B4 TaxID=1149862 RepID=I9LBS5_9FIRM|nr:MULTISPECIES: HlyD family type I secretion periplasmic adaptor subunit [Pelosinus]EIW17786.1 type I secretion membrane fusion protein, HlyD family [Pelosinus fermentans B4]EIW23748.1 type I secretion membrane fusion protein, HlyD family [Pelosinus fermentans A11]OAM94671.1 type I secretion membrane fusion protein, HlyD family [Pelosinus fermentans DSM 17108]SDR15052.1 hemolysin D [Pelosinus fermentans]
MLNKMYGYMKNKEELKNLPEKVKEFYERVKIKNIERFKSKEAEFLPAALEIVESPPSYGSRTVLWTFFILAVIALLWVTFGSVNEVAIAPGKIIPNGYVRVLQAEDKGIIKKIHVVDGQKVQKGDLLLELDTTYSADDLAKVKREAINAQLEVERLTAEKENRSFLPHAILEAEENDRQAQINLYNSRNFAYQTRFEEARHMVQQYQQNLLSAQVEKNKLTKLHQLAKEKESKLEQLVNENAISKFTLIDQQSKREEVEQNLAEQESIIKAQESLLSKSQASLARVVAEKNVEVDTKLVEARQKRFYCNEALKKAEEKNRLATIVAPDDGYISNLAVHTIGGIVTPAQVLLEVVPDKVSLEVEAWVANKDIGFIQKGQSAEVKIESFNFQKYGTIPAVVVTISPNAVEDREKGNVYRVILQMDRDHVVVNNQETRFNSGMVVNAEIKTRQKQIYEFFLEPFKKYKSESLRER